MHIASLDQILIWIEAYKYWIIFPLTIIEGPIVTIISAFLASQGRLNPVTLFFVALSGDMVGDFLHYVFGRWFYGHVLVKYEKRFRKIGDIVETGVSFVRENPGKTIVFGKWTQAAGSAVLIGAGAARIPLSKFFGYCVIGTAPKLVVLIAFGYAFGSAYARIDTYIGKISLLVFALFCVLAAYFFHKKRV